MGVEVVIDCQGDLQCQAIHGPSQDRLQTDAPRDNGGEGNHFSPTDLVAAAFGTCAGTTMDLVGKRNGIQIAGTRIQVIKEMVADPKRRIGRLVTDIHFPKSLEGLNGEQKKLLEDAARFCPVKMSLNAATEVTFTFHYG